MCLLGIVQTRKDVKKPLNVFVKQVFVVNNFAIGVSIGYAITEGTVDGTGTTWVRIRNDLKMKIKVMSHRNKIWLYHVEVVA